MIKVVCLAIKGQGLRIGVYCEGNYSQKMYLFMLSFASHGALTLATDCAIGVLLVVWLNSAGNFFYSSARVSKIDKGTRPRNRPAHRLKSDSTLKQSTTT